MPDEDVAELDDVRFETAIRETVEAVGGVLLFQMKLQDAEIERWAAAVAVGKPGAIEIVILDLPCGQEGGNVRVCPVSDCTLPIASIASAYAGLAETWGKAA